MYMSYLLVEFYLLLDGTFGGRGAWVSGGMPCGGYSLQTTVVLLHSSVCNANMTNVSHKGDCASWGRGRPMQEGTFLK